MNILITGVQGFIGRKVSYFLVKKKMNVYGIGRGKLSVNEIKKLGLKKNISGQINTSNLKKFNKIE